MMFYKETDLKETTIGEIPNDWNIVRLGDENISKIIMGQSPPSSTYNKEKTGLPFLQGKMEFGEIYPSTSVYCSEPIKIADPDDVLFSVRAPVGDINVAPYRLCIGRGLAAIRFNDKVTDHLFYFYYFQKVKKRLEALGRGSTFKAINKDDLQNLLVPLPSLKEQKKIVGVLGVVDLAVAKAGEVIAKTERLKKGLMQELLTKGIGHKEYKQIPIGKIPKNWEFVRIKELGELQYGYTTSAAQENTGIKFLRITDIKEDGSVNWEQVPYCHIGENEFDKYALQEGDLLFARIGATAGKTTYIGQKVRGIFASYLIRLKTIKEDVHPPFVFYFTQSATYWSQALRQREGQLKKGINATMLSKFLVPLPSFEEQQRIAGILSAVDHKLKLERKEKAKLERVKRGLMDLLLTGKVRVKVD